MPRDQNKEALTGHDNHIAYLGRVGEGSAGRGVVREGMATKGWVGLEIGGCRLVGGEKGASIAEPVQQITCWVVIP